MGTRGAWGFVIDGIEKITYNHWDSYPSSLGLDVLRFVRSSPLDRVRDRAAALRVVDPQSKPTAVDIGRLRAYANTNVGSQGLDDWYVLLRETQGDPGATLAAGVVIDGSDFPLDSLFCEYAYVIDFDAGRLDAYVGFQCKPPTDGLWAGRTGSSGNEGYYPCQRVASWPLSDLPSDEAFQAAYTDDEDTEGGAPDA